MLFRSTDITYKLVNIELFIPLVGNPSNYCWNKVLLYLDDEPLFSGIHYYYNGGNYAPELFKCNKINLLPGVHTFRLAAASDCGTLYIPLYELRNLEGIGSSISAKLFITGIN